VGGAAPVKVDSRLISATNRDLQAMIADGGFREDLFYRVGVFPLTLPPLRERRDDLPGLARMFLARSAAGEGVTIDTFSTAAMEAISHASWPGNVRQLENIIQRAVILADGSVIRPQDLQGLHPSPRTHSVDASATSTPAAANAGAGLCAQTGAAPIANQFMNGEGHIRRLLDIESEVIAQALTLYRGRMTEAARRLGIGRSTLYRKIDDLQLDK
jgi:DNA-binding NtrC family response regulator